MGTYKILLEDSIGYDFTLIAIHGSLEPYYIAFLLNKYLDISLERRRKDLIIDHKELQASYPLFESSNEAVYVDYFVLANKKKTKGIQEKEMGLFGAQQGVQTTFVIPEMPQVDYFIKIVAQDNAFAKAKLLKTLNSIPQIVTAYHVDVSQLKNKENLIFE